MAERIPSDAELCAIVEKAINNFRGDTEVLRGAIGYAFMARSFGWKPTLLMTGQKTIKLYEEILHIDSRTLFLEEGPTAHRSVAWRAVQKVSNFWKAVKGEIKGIRSSEVT